MSNDSEDSDRVTEEERLALAVEELRWSAAIASFEALAVEGIGAFRTRPGLEESILTMLAAGPVGAVRSVVARLLPTETDRFRSVAISRERAQLGIFRANLRWMDEQKAVGDYPGAAMHFSRASRVALVHESQGSSIRAEFSAMVELASSVEAVFEDSLADPHYLQRPHEADRIVADVLGDADPGNWMQIVMTGISSSPHDDLVTEAFDSMLRRLSWPTLRAMWWMLVLQPEAIPSTGAGYPQVGAFWIRLAGSPPTGEPDGSFGGSIEDQS